MANNRKSQKEFKQQCKPWITIGSRKSIRRRDKILQQFINTKDELKKEEFHNIYKFIRNIVSLIRLSKKDHYGMFFNNNFNDIRKTWEGIKSIINIRNLVKSQASSLLIGKVIS